MKLRARTFGLAAAGLLFLGCIWAIADLTVIPHGIAFRGPDSLVYHVRPNAWVTRITGSDATTTNRTINLAWPRAGHRAPSSYLVGHEWRHLWQRTTSPANPDATASPWFELRHITSAGFRDSVELDATEFGKAHSQDPHFTWVAAFLRDRVVVR